MDRWQINTNDPKIIWVFSLESVFRRIGFVPFQPESHPYGLFSGSWHHAPAFPF
jgi:hypothetical protein